jgi:endonuclease YncB( thermonuclease family)
MLPSPSSYCGSWPAGHEATEHLKQLVSGKRVIREPKATDRFGNTLVRCTADKVDIGEAMVRNGYAWAFVDSERPLTGSGGKVMRTLRRSALSVHIHTCSCSIGIMSPRVSPS